MAKEPNIGWEEHGSGYTGVFVLCSAWVVGGWTVTWISLLEEKW